MSAGSDRSLADTAGGGCDRSLQPRPRQRPKSSRQRGPAAIPRPTQPNEDQLSVAEESYAEGAHSEGPPRRQSEDLVQVGSTAPCLDDPKGPPTGLRADELVPRPRRTARKRLGGAETSASQTPQGGRVSTIDPGDILPGHARCYMMYKSVGVITAGIGVPAP